MTTSVMPDLLTNILAEEPIAPEKLAYLQARAKLRLHDLILRMFNAAEDGPNKLDQATIARRLNQSRARTSQQLGAPGNWTLDSAAKLAAAIGGEIEFQWLPFPKPANEYWTLTTTTAMTGFISARQHDPTANTGPLAGGPKVGSSK